MHLEPPASLASDVVYPAEAAVRPAHRALRPAPLGDEEDATLRLLRACVEALTLLQGKVEDLEEQVETGRDGAARGLLDLRADITAVQTSLVEANGRHETIADRMTVLEVETQETARRHAEDVAVARTEAATWRMRGETDVMAFDQLSSRMTSLEEGLGGKLDEARQTLMEREADNARLQVEAKAAVTSAEKLRSRLTDVDATIADQRARIACLQNKLATATYAIRLDQMSRSMDSAGLGSPSGHEILDLAPLPAGNLVSAA